MHDDEPRQRWPRTIRERLTALWALAILTVIPAAGCDRAPDRAAEPGGDDRAAATDPVYAGPPIDATSDCTPWEPTVVELRGTLVVSLRYGPPGYGETPDEDKKLSVPFLEHDRPIVLCTDPDNGRPGERDTTTEVQMNFTYLKPWPRELYDRPVAARGTLYPAVSGYHYLPAVMMVDDIRPLDGDDDVTVDSLVVTTDTPRASD